MEYELKEFIKKKYKSINNFCTQTGFSYSTIANLLRRGVSGSSIDVVMRVCHALDIDVEALANGEIVELRKKNILSPMEKELIEMFRSTTEHGRARIISTVVSICDEIEKNPVPKDTGTQAG